MNNMNNLNKLVNFYQSMDAQNYMNNMNNMNRLVNFYQSMDAQNYQNNMNNLNGLTNFYQNQDSKNYQNNMNSLDGMTNSQSYRKRSADAEADADSWYQPYFNNGNGYSNNMYQNMDAQNYKNNMNNINGLTNFYQNMDIQNYKYNMNSLNNLSYQTFLFKRARNRSLMENLDHFF